MWPFKKKKKAAEQPIASGFDPGMSGKKNPPHHYVLAHVALRNLCFERPTDFFGVMGSENRDAFLADVWKSVRENCDSDGTPTFEISDVRVMTCRINDSPAIIVTMPPPSEVAEAHFVGIALKLNVDVEPWPENPEVVYLTLEKGISMQDSSERTVLCGWAIDGDQFTHYNMGNGPAATEEDFAEAIQEQLK